MYSEDIAAIIAKIPQDDSSDDNFGTEEMSGRNYFSDEKNDDEDDGPPPMLEYDSETDSYRIASDQLFSDILRDFVKSDGRNVPDSNLLLQLVDRIDPYSMPRISVLNQINDVVLSSFRYGERESARQLTRAVLPSVLKFLTDESAEVRTKSCNLLSTFLQYDLDKNFIENEICPAVVTVSDLHPRIGANLMGKLAFYLDEEIIKKYFLDKFVDFCMDNTAYTRELCAANFGNMCEKIGRETAEKKLLPVFIDLCRDKKKEVRLCCVENFMTLTCICSLEARKNFLAPVLADLLVDPCQCVRVLSYRILGAFICTFSDPSISGLECEKNGEINFVGRDGFHFSFRTPKREEILNYVSNSHLSQPLKQARPLSWFLEHQKKATCKKKVIVVREDQENNSSGDNEFCEEFEDEESGCNNSEDITSSGGNGRSSDSDDSDKKVDDAFNTFRFWRTPLLEPDYLELEPERDEIGTNLNILDNELTKLSDKLAECSTKSNLEEIKTESVISSASTPDSGWNSASTTPPKTDLFGDSLKENALSDILYGKRSDGNEDDPLRQGNCAYVPNQEIVPQLLLDYFVSMTEPFQAEKTDEEIAQHCAYFLPAVALTLGPDNWIFLRKAYKYLAGDFQWKVRKTVASSIYELASILGEEIAARDLVPIFRGFIRDLDEVRIGALEHLADFLNVLDSDTRNMLLPLLKEFLKTDNDRNWRYRKELGEQIRLSINLFNPVDCLKHLAPMTTCLLCDKVASVRQKAIALMTDLIDYLSDESHFQIALLEHLVEEFAENSLWRQRQTFVLLCSELAKQQMMDSETFATMLLGHLLKLSDDSIPNIRLCVARCLADDVINRGYISPDSPHFKTISDTLESLKENQDSDVRFYAGAREEEQEMSSLNNSWEMYSSAEYHVADSTTESMEISETLENSPNPPGSST